MRAQFKKNKVASQIMDLPENSPSILVNGKSKFAKNHTFKIFNETVEEFGQIIDFNCNANGCLKFSIKTTEENYKPMIMQLKNNECLVVENIIYKGKTADSSALILYLIIIVEVHRNFHTKNP